MTSTSRIPAAPGIVDVALVDDDESVRRAFARLVRAAGMQSRVYASAEEFLADPALPRPGCLVLDVQLGGMSGLELAAALAEAGDCPNVVFMTATDDEKTREEAARAGCAAFFSKNDPGAQLLATIRELGRDAAGRAAASLARRSALTRERQTARAEASAEFDHLLERAREAAESMSRFANASRACTDRSMQVLAFVYRSPRPTHAG